MGTSLSSGLHGDHSRHLACVPCPFVGVQPKPQRKATGTWKTPRAKEGPALIPANIDVCVVSKGNVYLLSAYCILLHLLTRQCSRQTLEVGSTVTHSPD